MVIPNDPAATEPVEVTTNLFLHSSQEWKLATFFLAIGVKKKHEPLHMRWNLQGLEGWCHMAPREFNDKTYNNVAYFIEPDKAPKRGPTYACSKACERGKLHPRSLLSGTQAVSKASN